MAVAVAVALAAVAAVVAVVAVVVAVVVAAVEVVEVDDVVVVEEEEVPTISRVQVLCSPQVVDPRPVAPLGNDEPPTTLTPRVTAALTLLMILLLTPTSTLPLRPRLLLAACRPHVGTQRTLCATPPYRRPALLKRHMTLVWPVAGVGAHPRAFLVLLDGLRQPLWRPRLIHLSIETPLTGFVLCWSVTILKL